MAKIIFEDKVNTKQSSTPRRNSIIDEDINDIKASINSLYDGLVYSSTEVKTNKKWVDDKDIYKKTLIINRTAMTLENNYFTLPVSTLKIDNLFVDKEHSYWENVNGNTTKKFPIENHTFTTTNTYTNFKDNSMGVILDTSEIKLFVGGATLSTLIAGTTTLYLSIEYTKE